VLFAAVQAAWNTFVQRAAASGRTVPRFCVREVEGYLRCGVLGHGFARVFCARCKQDEVVAFSCKGRGFCPACGAARMVDTAAWLVDRVIPEVPVRQWVLSLPYRLRVQCAYDPDVCARVRRVLVAAVSRWYERRARGRGAPRPRAGAVAFLQRFDSALRLNVHLHVLWADGVFAHEPGSRAVTFCEQEEVTDGDVAKLVRAIRDRVVRALRRLGKWPAATDPADGGDADPGDDVLRDLGAAAVQGLAALGERAGTRDVRVGRGTRNEPFVKGPLCAELEGFSLHAGVRVAARDRSRLEHLCRYAGRPALAENRLTALPDGRLLYALKRRWQDGSVAVVLEPQVLMERLCALVPRPRRHLVTYHGAFGPAAGIRPWVVPQGGEDRGGRGCRHRGGRGVGKRDEVPDGNGGEADGEERAGDADAGEDVRLRLPPRVVPHAPGKRRRGRPRLSWSDLLARVFATQALVCPRCGGPRKVLAAIHDPASIRKVLAALGLPFEVPVLSPARSPPRQQELEFAE